MPTHIPWNKYIFFYEIKKNNNKIHMLEHTDMENCVPAEMVKLRIMLAILQITDAQNHC